MWNFLGIRVVGKCQQSFLYNIVVPYFSSVFRVLRTKANDGMWDNKLMPGSFLDWNLIYDYNTHTFTKIDYVDHVLIPWWTIIRKHVYNDESHNSIILVLRWLNNITVKFYKLEGKPLKSIFKHTKGIFKENIWFFKEIKVVFVTQRTR